MSQADRGIRRASRQLEPGELVIASIAALEADGRRRQVVLVTERRVLIAGLRRDPPLEFPLDASCQYDRVGGVLTFTIGEQEASVRDVDELMGRTIVELLGTRTTHRTTREIPRDHRIRIVT